MNCKITLFSLTIKQCEELEEKLKVAAQAGYDGIDLMYPDVAQYIDIGHTIDEVGDLLEKYNLEVTHLGALGYWQFRGGSPWILPSTPKEETDPQELSRKTKLFFEYCSGLNCKYALAVSAIEESGNLQEAADDLKKLSEIAEPYGVKIAFEFVGFAKQMKDINTAWEVVKRVNSPNVGITLDTFHFYRGGSKIDDLVKVPVDKIFIVHINDAKDKPIELLEDMQDRLYPGEGVIPIKQILDVLEKKKYRGPICLEIFNPRYWEEDPNKVALEGKKALEKVLKK